MIPNAHCPNCQVRTVRALLPGNTEVMLVPRPAQNGTVYLTGDGWVGVWLQGEEPRRWPYAKAPEVIPASVVFRYNVHRCRKR